MADERGALLLAGAGRGASGPLAECEDERARRVAAERAAAGPRLGWITYVGSTLTTLTALAALVVSMQQSRASNAIAEQGQINDLYTAAASQLSSANRDARLAGIYALGRIMRLSPTDQPVIVDELSAFIRDHAPGDPTPVAIPDVLSPPPTDVSAALTVLGQRDQADDGGSQEDLRGVDFADLDLSFMNLNGANLSEAHLEGTDLIGAHLSKTTLTFAYLDGATFPNAHLEGANLAYAVLHERYVQLDGITSATLTGANFIGTPLCQGTHPIDPGGYVCSQT